jgi:aspartate-semialdehyde dehydrogenase
MKPLRQGFSVGVVGASSLLGKELLAVLKERNFPVARLVTAEDDEREPDIPVVDLREGLEPSIADESLDEKDFDIVFVAAAPTPASGKSQAGGQSPFLRSSSLLAQTTHCMVIDLSDGLAGEPGGQARIPFLERMAGQPPATSAEPCRRFVAAHPAAIVIGSVLMRISASFGVSAAVAQVFAPASEIGAQAVEELQHQTASLLTFKKLPDAVFGRQLAFNLLPRFGPAREKVAPLAGIESRIHHELEAFLSSRGEAHGRIPRPAVRVVQAPVFHSVAVSLYVETTKAASEEEIEHALKHERIKITRLRAPAPTQVETSGSSDILVDAVRRDASHANGAWIWAVADNLRLAAENAVEIAEAERGLAQAAGR